MNITTPLFLMTFFIAAHGTADIYQWVDKDGNTQYSDKQPSQENYETKTYQSSTPAIDPELEQYRQQIKINQQERERAQALAKQQAKETRKKAKQRKRYCDNLKARQHIDNDVTTFATRHPDGSRTVWTGEQRKQYTKSLKDNLKKYCS